MMLLPPKEGTCPICATSHAPEMPHNQQSLYYQYRFYGIRGRWPTWADAVAHCTEQMRMLWEQELREHGVWSAPDNEAPVADPPCESVRQCIGDLRAPGFGPEHDDSV